MHALIPFASASSEVAAHVLRDLSLPVLTRLLQRLAPTQRDDGDEFTLSPPHERALARAWGWPQADGALPFAAKAAIEDGIAVGDVAWGLLTPAHWVAGRDHVTMVAPEALALDANDSRALFEAVRPLFESEGFVTAWGAPTRWYVAHPSLEGLPCASLDRVVGRSIDTWLPKTDQGRLLRRLQSEVQLTLHTHPINEAREAREAPVVNSFWISGCGVSRPTAMGVQCMGALRVPLLSLDWSGWAEAWRELDAGPMRALLQCAEAGQSVALTLCGERSSQGFESQSHSILQRLARRWQAAPAHAVLEGL